MASGTDISTSLRNLASARTDLFGDESDEAERKRKEEEDNKKRKERERMVWDGHANSAQAVTDNFQGKFTLDNDIQKMHARLGLS
jgi:splicing factor 3A subunit 1